MLGGQVLGLERERAGGDVDGNGGEGAEVHEDGGGSGVGDHDVACFLIAWGYGLASLEEERGMRGCGIFETEGGERNGRTYQV